MKIEIEKSEGTGFWSITPESDAREWWSEATEQIMAILLGYAEPLNL